MAYLLPRLHFAGEFQTDPSTVNNDPTHYDNLTFRSSFQLLQDEDSRNGWWNPIGSASFRFQNCTVTGAVNSSGARADTDAAIGAELHDALAAPPAKLVDIDPEQQLISEIWGLTLSVGTPGAFGFVGDFAPAAFQNIWPRTRASDDLSRFSSFWNSIVRLKSPIIPGASEVLAEIAAAASSNTLVMRFVVDGYVQDRNDPRFTYGRVVGTFAPYRTPGPRYFLLGRPLHVVTPPPSENFDVTTGFAELSTVTDADGRETTHVTVDLGNSLPTVTSGGDLINIGDVYVAYLTPDAGARIVGPAILYTADGWYNRTAGMVTFPVSSSEASELKAKPLAIVYRPRDATTEHLLLAESADGVYVHADSFAFRMEVGMVAETLLYATKFGVPASDVKIHLVHDSSIMEDQVTPGAPNVGVPKDALSFPSVITTGNDGTAILTLKASNPGNPRVYIDGQIYGVAYAPGKAPPVGATGNASDILNVLVFNEYPVVDDPSWVGHIQPILGQYANLYPVMRPMVDLGSYASIMSRLQSLKIVFFADIENPNYMPVTRDMSAGKRHTLQNWLRQSEPKYMHLNSSADLCKALQYAIELEHATIPVYLAALYSIKPGRNVYVAAMIRSVVIEEMLHMALMSNLLLSIGGSPNIGTPGFVPSYPGPLPGGVGTGLIARLRKCSIDQIRDVFMAIETPGTIAILENNEAIPGGPTEMTKYTIGWFYEQISAALEAQQHSLNFGQNLEKQPEGWKFENTTLFKIDSYESAKKAIKIIVEQGEGQGAFDPSDDDGMALAHYYKFAEIVVGRRLVSSGQNEEGEEQFSYTGSAVPFEEDGVYNAMDDPVLSEYPDGSRARVLAESFADTYQTMLNNLHVAFNGKPGTLGNAIGMMYTLSAQARELMQTPSGRDDGTTAGVAFQAPVPALPMPYNGKMLAMKMKRGA